MENDHNVTQLVDRDGIFNAVGLEDFVKKAKLAKCGVDYAVVSIMGPQSSGKSTLMNHLFHTKFREMNAEEGSSQTTQGIWLSECVDIKPFTMVMDLEGNDGIQRGQEITFEKQAAIFALAVSDILMINMRSCEIGRENAGNKPLLRTVFEVMLQSLGPGRQTTLMFVIRDLEKTPLEKLRQSLLSDIHKIWDAVQKPDKCKTTRFDETFRVEVVGLPNYVHQEEKFKEEVVRLRGRFINSIYPGGIADGDRNTVVPALEFSFNLQQMWKEIKENPNLNLPNNKIMISTVRCEAIANDKLDKLRQNEAWVILKKKVESSPVPDFGKRLSSIIATCLSEYDEEVKYFDNEVRKTKRKEVLERKALDEVYPAYETMLGHLRHKEFEYFKAKMEQSNTNKTADQLFHSVYTYTEAAVSQFDKGSKECLVVIANKKEQTKQSKLGSLVELVPFYKDSSGVNWDASNIRDKLRNDIHGYAITLFVREFMDTNTTDEDAEKEFKGAWREWLLRLVGIVVDWFYNPSHQDS